MIIKNSKQSLETKPLQLARVTIRLQVSDYSQLSDFNFAKLLEQNTAVYAPITFEEVVIVTISENCKAQKTNRENGDSFC